MRLIQQLSMLAVRQVLGDRADSLIDFVRDRAGDPSHRLMQVLYTANDRAWRAIEIALAGDSFWSRLKAAGDGAETRAFRDQVRAFLDTGPLPDGRARDPQYRKACLNELRTARTKNELPGELPFEPETVVIEAKARFDHTLAPQDAMRNEMATLGEVAVTLMRLGYANLAEFVSLRPAGGVPLLMIAVRYFFRDEVQRDPKLSAVLVLDKLDALTHAQESGFAGLGAALAEQGQRIESLLGEAMVLLEETRDGVREANAQLAEMRAEMERQARQNAETQAQMLALIQSIAAQAQAAAAAPPPTLAPPASPSAPAPEPAEVQRAKELLARTQAMSEEQKRANPELVAAAAKLETTVSEFDRKTGRRRNVMPSAIFGAPAAPPAAPTPTPVPTTPAAEEAGEWVIGPFGKMPRTRRK